MSDSIGTGVEHVSATDTGRYLYCLVDGEAVDSSAGLDIAGIDGEPVSVVAAEDTAIGAVVHARTDPYDSSDLSMLRDWLLAHQRVVEAAGDRFGTPLPVRFDTVIDGDDATVTAWLAQNADTIADAFDTIAGRWEYRATLSWDSTAFEDGQHTDDPELARIGHRIDQSDAGKRFLLRKRHDQRLQELVRQRRDALTKEFVERLGDASIRLTERPVQSEAAASLGVEMADDAVAQVALLALREQESAIGAILEEMADKPGVDVRFTGPWPPYTFAPTIGED